MSDIRISRLHAVVDSLIAREVDRRAGLLDPELTEFHDERVRWSLERFAELGGSEAEALTMFVRTLTHWPM